MSNPAESQFERGDVVLVSFPHNTAEGQLQVKRRPAVIVSNDQLNAKLNDVLALPITLYVKEKFDAQVLVRIDKESDAGRAGGIKVDSVVDCTVISTLPKALLVNRIGRLPDETMHQVSRCLRYVLGDSV